MEKNQKQKSDRDLRLELKLIHRIAYIGVPIAISFFIGLFLLHVFIEHNAVADILYYAIALIVVNIGALVLLLWPKKISQEDVDRYREWTKKQYYGKTKKHGKNVIVGRYSGLITNGYILYSKNRSI